MQVVIFCEFVFIIETGKSDVYLNGYWANPIAFLFIENSPFEIDASLKSQEIRLEDFLVSIESKNDGHPLDIAKGLDLDLRIASEKFNFKNLSNKTIKIS